MKVTCHTVRVGKPLSVIVTVKMSEARTVNLADRLLVPSVTTIVCGPGAEDGTTNAHPKLMLPDGSVLQAGIDALEPSNVSVKMLEARKPTPQMLTVEPTFPDPGVTKMHEMTVNVAVALFVPSATPTV